MTSLMLICKSSVLPSVANVQAATPHAATQQCCPQSQTKGERAEVGGGGHTLALKCFVAKIAHITYTHGTLVKTSHMSPIPCNGTRKYKGANRYSPTSKYLCHTVFTAHQTNLCSPHATSCRAFVCLGRLKRQTHSNALPSPWYDHPFLSSTTMRLILEFRGNCWLLRIYTKDKV